MRDFNKSTDTTEMSQLRGSIRIQSSFEKAYLRHVQDEANIRLQKESATGAMNNVLTSIYEHKIIGALIETRNANLDAIETYFRKQRNRFSEKFFEAAIKNVKEHIAKAQKLQQLEKMQQGSDKLECTLKSTPVEAVRKTTWLNLFQRIFGRHE